MCRALLLILLQSPQYACLQVAISPETLSGTQGAQRQTCQWCRAWPLCSSPYFCECFPRESRWFLANLPWMQHRWLTGFYPEPKMQIILLWENQIITTTKIIALSLKAPFRILEQKQKCKEYQVYFHVYWKRVYSVFENLRSKLVSKSPPKK